MPESARQARVWPWLALLVISLGLTAAIAWHLLPAAIDLPTLWLPSPSPPPAPSAVATERRRVRLFFPQGTGEALKEVEREIPRRSILAEEVGAVLRELAKAEPGGRPAIPPAVEVRQVFLDAFGILYLDFNKEIQAVAEVPGEESELAISAVVNSLAANFSGVKRVQFLAEGKEMAGMAGGWDLRRPVSPRFPGEENPPVVSPLQE
jgi:hypothetical protein